MQRTIIIDGDIVAYKAASAVEVPINWGDVEDVGVDMWTLHAFPEDAIAKITSELERYVETLGADQMIVALTDKDNFRKSISEDYKSNRKNTRKPMVLPAMREFLTENYNCFIRPGLEADDVIGILMTNKNLFPGEKISVSVDKDFKTIPGKHYNMNSKEIYEVDEAEANYWHLHQTLTGDKTDGYSGCPGVGPVSADKILDPYLQAEKSYPEIWEDVLTAFDKKGLDKYFAIMQARLARILRSEDYNFKTKKPILWEPPGHDE